MAMYCEIHRYAQTVGHRNKRDIEINDFGVWYCASLFRKIKMRGSKYGHQCTVAESSLWQCLLAGLEHFVLSRL